MAHLGRHAARDPDLRPRLAAAVARRHQALSGSSGLNEEVFDALVLLAAGSFDRDSLARGCDRVADMVAEMDNSRRARLRLLGFDADEAAALSNRHTRNFM